jgi:ATP-dependent DNA ligase
MQAPEQLFAPFTSPDWLYELKFDGYRAMAGVQDGEVKLLTKSGADCTKWFPEIPQALATLPGGPHIIDGEACVLRPDGTSDFNLLQERARRRRWYPGAPVVTYCVFDLLVHGGKLTINLPLVRRKQLLEELVAGVPGILFVKDLDADANVFQAMVKAGLQIEGVVAKRRASLYWPGARKDDWRKIKRPGWDEGRNWKG